MPIYTKRGDRGETSLPGEKRLSKTDQIFEFLGWLDRINAEIGLAIAYMEREGDRSLIKTLEGVQSLMLVLGALTAQGQAGKNKLKKISRETEKLEKQIDRWDRQLPILRNFILSGGTVAGAMLHVLRTTVRSSEREYHRLAKNQIIPEIAEYLNRLSDFFFQAARHYNYQHKQAETVWRDMG